MDKKTLVANLIAHPNTQFEESDSEWLSVLHEEQLDKMLPVDLEEDDEDEEDLEATINRLPDDLKEVLNNHLSTLTANKDAMVAKVLGHTANKFTKEQLEAMPVANIEAIAALVPEKESESAPAPAGNADPGIVAPKVEPLTYNTYLGISGGGTDDNKEQGVKVLDINTVSDQLGKDK